MDEQFKELIKELGAAIDKSLSDSKRIGEVASRTKERGYDIGLNLEATIRVSKQCGSHEQPGRGCNCRL